MFHLTVTAQVGKAFVPQLRSRLRRAAGQLRGPLREVSLVLVNDRAMSDLHERFMNLPGPTDVLTFPIEVDRRGRTLAGEVYVCVPEARRRAKEHGTRAGDEVLLYALHGMLHLCGFDDRTPAEFQRMHRTEDRILRRIGVGPVFNPREPRRAKRATSTRRAARPTRRASASDQRGGGAARGVGAAREGVRR
jgi:probable rRNA maturation factor